MGDIRAGSAPVSAAPDLRQLIQAAGDAVIASDVAGLITVWNPAAARMFGFTEAEALGTSLDLIIPERHRRRHWEQWEKTMKTGETRYGEELLRVPALHKDGRTLSIAFSIGLLRTIDQAIVGVLAIVRDETVRWAEERALKRRVAELEAGLGTAPSS